MIPSYITSGQRRQPYFLYKVAYNPTQLKTMLKQINHCKYHYIKKYNPRTRNTEYVIYTNKMLRWH